MLFVWQRVRWLAGEKFAPIIHKDFPVEKSAQRSMTPNKNAG